MIRVVALVISFCFVARGAYSLFWPQSAYGRERDTDADPDIPTEQLLWRTRMIGLALMLLGAAGFYAALTGAPVQPSC